MIKRIYLLCFFCVSVCTGLNGQISLINFSSGYSSPVDIKNCGDDRLFIVEQDGIISLCDTDGVRNPVPFLNIISRVQPGGERGLLGLAFPDDFLSSGYFYVNYTCKPHGDTRISRFHVDSLTPDSADPNSEEILLTIYQPYSNHNGGHLDFGPDGYLYIGMGDGGAGGDPEHRSQNPDSLLGKMLRIAVDPSDSTYSIPPTNPFAGDSTAGAPEVWSLGLRNPWRFSFDALTGDMWMGDVGQNQYEEIDMEPAGTPGGSNYGWKCFEANQQYSTASGCQAYSFYDEPVHQYSHSSGCSVTGGYVYRGAKFQELYGKYFYADHCQSQIQYLVPNGAGGFTNTNLGLLGAASISTFGEDRHGELYCAGLNSGNIYRFASADCSPVATINTGNDTLSDCSTGSVDLSVPLDSSFTYLWTFNGDTASTGNALTAIQQGIYYVSVINDSCSNSDSVFVEFVSPINVSFTGLDTLYCIDDVPSVMTPSHIPGVFSGPGVNGTSFDPAQAGTGNHMVTYDHTTTSGCTFSYSLNVTVDGCVGVHENNFVKSINIYPNPAGEQFFVQAILTLKKNIRIEILDFEGRILQSEEVMMNSGENLIRIHHSLASGIYVVTISDGVTTSSLKLGVN